jgi:phage-related protein
MSGGFSASLCHWHNLCDKHDAAKVLKGFGGAGVLEVVEDDIGGTYRAVYTVKFAEAVLSLTVSRKKASAASPRRRKKWTSFTQG